MGIKNSIKRIYPINLTHQQKINKFNPQNSPIINSENMYFKVKVFTKGDDKLI